MKMKKRIRSLVLCAAMVLVLAAGLLPQRAQAAYSNEQLGLAFHGSFIRAQGNAIVLEDGGDGYTRIKVGGQYVDFSQMKYSYGDSMFTCKAGDPTAADLSEVDIYGGWDCGGSGNTSITINGGNVAIVHGGGSSGDMTGSVTITMNGGRAQRLIAAGNGGSVSSSTITVNGGTVSVMIETVGEGVTGDSALVITGGSVGDIYRAYADITAPGGELSLYTPGIGRLHINKDSIDNYVILEGKNWSAKGNTAKAMNGNYLTVNAGETLTVPAGETFTGGIDNYGVIYNYGTIGDIVDNQGIIHNYGTISAEVNQNDVGTVYNYGTVGTVNGGYVTKEVSYWPYYCTMDQSTWRSKEHNHKDDYTGTVIPSAGHVLAASFDAVLTNANGSKTYLKSGVDFEYDSATGKIRIPNSKLTGPVYIRTYTLVDLDSDALDLRLSKDAFTFNGKEHKPVLLWNGSPVDGDGITATYENNVSAGTGKVTFTADEGSAYTGQLTLEFTIHPAKVEDVDWTTEVLTYNGQMQYPTIVGKLGDYELKWPEDYKNSGAAQVDAGNYTVSVHGQGNFIGSKELAFIIDPLNIGENAELVLSEHVYDGSEQKATVKSFRVEGITLQEGVDFTAQIQSGTDAGEYEFAFEGIGNFTGFYEGLYNIAPKALTADDLEFADETITKVYDGEAVSTAKVQVKAGVIGNEEPIEVAGLCVFDSAWAGVATKVTFTTAETDLGNYMVPADLQLEKAATITHKEVTVENVAAQDRVYDGTKNVTLGALYYIDGVEAEDYVYAEFTAGEADSKNVGQRTASLSITLTGEDAANYRVSQESQKEVTFEITPKSWSVTDIEVVGEDFLVTAEGILPGDDATPEVVKAIWGYGNYQVDGKAALVGKDQENYEPRVSFSANVFRPEAGKEYTTTTKEWTTSNFTVTAAEGFTVCLLPEGTFGQDLGFSEEGEKEVTFYVKSEQWNFVSRPVKETYRIDRTAPVGKITIGEMSWDDFDNEAVAFDTYVNKALEVKITADDSLSGVETVEYLVSSELRSEAELKARGAWKEGNSVTLKAENGEQAVVYARITDKAGNMTLLSSAGFVFDTVAPKVSGVKEGVTYYVDTEFTVSDTNLKTVEFADGTAFPEGQEWKYTVEGGTDGAFTIVATDKAGNVTKVSFKTGALSDAEKQVEEADIKDMTKGEEQALRKLLEDLKAQETDNATDEEKATIGKLTEKLEKLLPASTPNTGDLLLPVAGTVCVLALLGMVAIIVWKRKRG